MNPERFTRVALTVIRQSPKLQRCRPESLLGALMTSAQLGLEPGPLGEAYLVPYGEQVTFIPGYRGLLKLAWNSGQLKHISARIVYDADAFDYAYGLHPDLTHKPARGDRGAITDVYACAVLLDGGAEFEVLSVADVEAVRARSRAAKDGPWVTDWEAMARKGLALDTPIPTVHGWTTMGDLRVGDQLFDLRGAVTAVRAVSEVKEIDCYRVTFANGTTIVCDAEHVWLAAVGRNAASHVKRHGWSTYAIDELYELKQTGQRVVMPLIGPLDMPPAELPIDPWLLGYWLGHGDRSAPRVTCHVDHADEVAAAIASTRYQVGAIRPDPRSQAVTIGIRGGFGKDLANEGLLGDQHVPTIYLRAPTRQRLALLRGLMDSNGTIDAARGRAIFVNTNERLTDAVAELARSLGEIVHRHQRQQTGFGKTVTTYTVGWLPTDIPVTLSAKVQRVQPRQVSPYRGVKSIERVPSVPTRCIAVDSPTRTFAAGLDMVPTHNTAVRQLAKWLPMATVLTRAIAAEGSVRTELDPDVLDTFDEAAVVDEQPAEEHQDAAPAAPGTQDADTPAEEVNP